MVETEQDAFDLVTTGFYRCVDLKLAGPAIRHWLGLLATADEQQLGRIVGQPPNMVPSICVAMRRARGSCANISPLSWNARTASSITAPRSVRCDRGNRFLGPRRKDATGCPSGHGSIVL
jgi:hypothetical protein